MHLHGYGLPGASAVAYGLTCLELEAGDAGVRSAVSVQGSLAMYAIWRWGSEEQKERWLPAMHAGEAIGCFGLTEPDAGSDPGVDADARAARRLRLDPERRQDVDHERDDRRRRRRLGAHRRRRDPRLPRREGHARLHAHPRSTRRSRCARRSRPSSSSRTSACRMRTRSRRCARCAARCPASNEARYGIVWGAVGAAPRVLRGGARLREGADRLRKADRGLPAHTAEARRDGARGEPRRPRGAARRPDEGQRDAAAGAGEHGQDGQRPRGARGLPDGARRSSARTASPSSTR